jgi:hypothetical protein
MYPGASPFYEQGGRVVIEAEHAHLNTPGSGTGQGSQWQFASAPDAEGDGYMATPPGGKTFNAPLIESDAPRLGYNVRFDTPGTYYVWIKARGHNDNSDSLHFGLNGQAVSTGYSDALEVPKLGEFTWRSTTKSVRPVIQIPAPGVYAVDIWVREDGAWLDRLCLTTDAAYVPQNLRESSLRRYDLCKDDRIDYLDFAAAAEYWLVDWISD